MRRLLIGFVLPTAFVSVPLLAAVLIAAAVPSEAQQDFLRRLKYFSIDWIILGLGMILFFFQTVLSWRALRWRRSGFDERGDKMLTHLASAAEWFPLLGLLGTVAAIMQTFKSINAPGITTQEIIRNYAPAITATGSGLFMALMNILPTWMVQVGREVIQSLAGGVAPKEELP